jgi:ketosteroid isomerase-like protein
MSQENVEMVRRGYESAFDQGRFDLPLNEWDEECEFVPAMAGAVEGKVYRGHAGLRRYFEELFESFAEVRLENREYRDLGDSVLVLYWLQVRGHDSGVVLDQPGAALYEFRSGKITRGRSFLSRSEALESAGLSE